MAIASDVLEANYQRFRKLFNESRLSLEKAISADENSKFHCFGFILFLALNTKRQVLTFYKKAVRDLNAVACVSPEKCTPSKRSEIEKSKQTIAQHLILTNGRISDLSKLFYCSLSMDETSSIIY